MPGYINSRKYVDDGRQKILEPHQQMLHKTLHSQVESRKVRDSLSLSFSLSLFLATHSSKMLDV